MVQEDFINRQRSMPWFDDVNELNRQDIMMGIVESYYSQPRLHLKPRKLHFDDNEIVINE